MTKTQRKNGCHRLVIALSTLVLVAAATAVRADWLVTRGGDRIETRGPWSERGDVVVFTLKSGTLASLRTSEVDLEASRRATAAAETAQTGERQEPAEQPKKKAVLVLTDADVGHRSPGQEEPAEAAAEDDSGAPVGRPAAEPVEVISWQEAELPDSAGLSLAGTARNTGGDVAAGLSMSVILYDADGKVLASAPSRLGAGSLGPGQSASFRADFPGVFSFAGASFDFSYQPLRTTTTPPEAQATPGREPQ